MYEKVMNKARRMTGRAALVENLDRRWWAQEGASRDGAVGESTGEAMDTGMTDCHFVGQIFDGWRGGWTEVNDGNDTIGWIEANGQVRGTAGGFRRDGG